MDNITTCPKLQFSYSYVMALQLWGCWNTAWSWLCWVAQTGAADRWIGI